MTRVPATAEEFAEQYAARSGTTIAVLQAHGREARPCDCGEDGCEGWQMARVEAVTRRAFNPVAPPEHLPRKCGDGARSVAKTAPQ